MKITNEILLEIGFIHNKERDEFYFIDISNIHITISKTNKWWLHINNKPPGYEILDIRDLLTVLYSEGIKKGVNQKVKEIKEVLGI